MTIIHVLRTVGAFGDNFPKRKAPNEHSETLQTEAAATETTTLIVGSDPHRRVCSGFIKAAIKEA